MSEQLTHVHPWICENCNYGCTGSLFTTYLECPNCGSEAFYHGDTITLEEGKQYKFYTLIFPVFDKHPVHRFQQGETVELHQNYFAAKYQIYAASQQEAYEKAKKEHQAKYGGRW